MAAASTGISAPAGLLRGSEKSKDIGDILKTLEDDIHRPNVAPDKHVEILQRLRNYTTSLDGLEPLLTRQGVSICCRYGFGGTSMSASRLAVRCLCNVLLQAPPTRQMFVDEDYLKETIERMKIDHPDDELQAARLLLLCTYETNLNFDQLFEQSHLAQVVNDNIARHAKLFSGTNEGSSPSPSDVAACSENLKLLYNLAAQCPRQVPLFFDSLLPVLKILRTVSLPSPPLLPPVSWLVNALVHLVQLGSDNSRSGLSAENPVFPQSDINVNANRLTDILHRAVQVYSDEEMDQNGATLLQVLLGMAESAPPGPKAHLKDLLLPCRDDEEQVLGKGNSLPAKLLRLCTSPMAPHLRELIPTMLFELSDADEKQFVQNIGYGFAAGFLLSRGIRMPSSGASGSRDSSGEATQRGEEDAVGRERNEKEPTSENEKIVEFNPITGQRLDNESEPQMPEMSDEEKEREAERLFVLFERLRATGIVDIENPVANAMREGRQNE